MEEEGENGGLRSIERSNLRGAQDRNGLRKRPAQQQRRRAPAAQPRRTVRRKSPMKRIIIFSVIIFVIVLVLVTTTFATTTLRLTLTSAELSVDGVFSAIREPAQSADIAYGKVGPYTETRSATITNITRERQNSYAEGTIMVHNTNTSGEKLDLVNRTRFQTKDGRIYRLSGKQIIPGGKTVNGEFVPGRKEVRVVADAIGNEFNLKEKGVRFTIPGLAKYKEFSSSYAVSTTKIVGGFSGERFIPDAAEEKAAREKLRGDIASALEQKLTEALQTNTLSKKIVFDSAKFITYESLENKQVDDAVMIQEKGEMYAVSFRETELASLLAKSESMSVGVPSSVTPTEVTVVNLAMEMVDANEFEVTTSTEFDFRLSGVAKVYWTVDEVLFLGDIAGKKRIEVEDIILNRYPQVQKINVFSIFPPWRTSVPGNRKKINVTVGYSRGDERQEMPLTGDREEEEEKTEEEKEEGEDQEE